MSATATLSGSVLNPDHDFIMHGRSTAYWERKKQLTNSQITNTTSKLSQHTQNGLYDPENYRDLKGKRYVHVDTMKDLANNLEVLNWEIGNTSSKGVKFIDQSEIDASKLTRTKPVSASEFTKPHSQSLRSDITDDELLKLYEERVGEIEELSGKATSPRDAQWFINPNHIGSTVEAPTLQSVGKTYRQGTEEGIKDFSDKDEIALRHFPVTLGSSYELCARGYPTARPLLSTSPPSMRTFRSKSARELKRAMTSRDHFDPKQRIDKSYLMTAEAPIIGSQGMYMTSPYQMSLGRLRLERLRLEESKLLEQKRVDELERIRGPKPKWYESKGTDFYYESNKNTQLVKSKNKYQDLLDYREDLLRASYSSLKRYNQQLDAMKC